jgi:hypothetical protein
MSPQRCRRFFLFTPGLFLLLALTVAASTNRPNEITTNGTADLIVNASGLQIIFERDLNLTKNLLWPGLLDYQNNDTLLWSNASNQDGRIIALESIPGYPGQPNIDAANITSGVIDAARLPDNSPFYNNVTLNISGLQGNVGTITANISALWTNSSSGASRITTLEGRALKPLIDSTNLTIVGNINMTGYNFTNTKLNASDVANLPAAASTYYDDRWIINGGIITSNISNGLGNVNVTGNISINLKSIVSDGTFGKVQSFYNNPTVTTADFYLRGHNITQEFIHLNFIPENNITKYSALSYTRTGFQVYIADPARYAFYPWATNTYDNGLSTNKWDDLWYKTGHAGDQYFEGNNLTLIVTTEGSDGLYNVMIPRKDLPKGYEYNSSLVKDYYAKNWGSLKKVKQGYDGDVVSADGVSLKALDASVKVIDADAKARADTVAALNAEIVSLKARLDKLEGAKT